MAQSAKSRTEAARPTGLTEHVGPLDGWIGIEYRVYDQSGNLIEPRHILKLVLNSHEARQIGNHFHAFAAKIEAPGGTKQ